MRIQKLVLKNFRKYEDASFAFHPKFTILIGENGAGKTTILDAVAIMLATYFQGSGIKIGRSTIAKTDKRLVISEKAGQVFSETQKEVYLSAAGSLHDAPLNWRRDAGDRGGKAKKLVSLGSKDRERISSGESPDLPLLLYYGSGRLWDVHRHIETEKPSSQLDAYRFCLDPKSNQKAFEKWFKKISTSPRQKQLGFPALQVVTKAVMNCIPGATDFFFDTDMEEVIIKFHDGHYDLFNNLSDGYRNMVAMVADIAHRASRLNPHFAEDSALRSSGIVLIDEIDLHLHPRWQRAVVRDLQGAFPNLQFIATTHSPFIIQSAASGEVIDLNQSAELEPTLAEGVASPPARAEYVNRSIEDIAEYVMGVEDVQRSERYQEMYDVAKKYYKLLEDSKDADPEEKEHLKNRLDIGSRLSTHHPFTECRRR